jgi:hypothetical protein
VTTQKSIASIKALAHRSYAVLLATMRVVRRYAKDVFAKVMAKSLTTLEVTALAAFVVFVLVSSAVQRTADDNRTDREENDNRRV